MCERFHKKANLVSGSSAVVVDLNCKCWKCDECSLRLKKSWRQRLEDLSALGEFFTVTVIGTGRDVRRDYKALTARLKRAGCEFIRINTVNGCEVFHQAFPGNRQTDRNETSWVDPRVMYGLAKLALDRMIREDGQMCMTSSRRLAVKRGDRRWRVVAKTCLPMSVINRRAREAGWSKMVIPGQVFPVNMLPSMFGSSFESYSSVSLGISGFSSERGSGTTAVPVSTKTAIF